MPAIANTAPAPAQPWWNPAWPYRIQIDCPAGEGDVAEVRVTLAGRTTPDGRDLRLIDEGGKPRTFEILHHDAKLKTLLRLAVPPGQPLRLWLYYGNLRASPIDSTKILSVSRGKAVEVRNAWRKNQTDRQAALDQQKLLQKRLEEGRRVEQAAVRSGQAPPQMLTNLRQTIMALDRQLRELQIPPDLPEPDDPSRWYARRGVLLKVYRKAQELTPRTLSELKQLAGRSTLEGAGFRAGISDGFNPFGTSEHYVSVYSGYLRIDAAGEYAFCSVSDDGSWVLVNGKTLIDWPGPHSWDGAVHGQTNGRIALEPGVARVEYFHEEATGPQLAFLGWRPPGQERFGAIPPAQWLSLRQAVATLYEAHDQPLLAIPEVRVLNTYWIRDTEGEQATLVEFADASRSTAGAITHRSWRFGDGLDGEGREARHVYFRLGRPEVTLEVRDARGNRDTVTCAPNIFQVDVQANTLQYGHAEQYSRMAADYDVERLERDDLLKYAEFWRQLEDWRQHARAADAFLRRFPDAPAAAELTATAARAYMLPTAYDPQRAERLLAKVLEAAKDPAARRRLLLARAHLLAWDLDKPAEAGAIYRELQPAAASVKGKLTVRIEPLCLLGPDEKPRPRDLARICQIGLGDVALLSGDYVAAEGIYRQVQAADKRAPDSPEELAKTGSYPYSVEDFLARGEYDCALQTLDDWEEEFPLQKLRGYTFFWRGKVLFVQRPGEQALRYLALAERVNPRVVHVPEAVWLHANCLAALGRWVEALGEFQRIRADFTASEFFAQAAGKIKECQGKLPASKTTD